MAHLNGVRVSYEVTSRKEEGEVVVALSGSGDTLTLNYQEANILARLLTRTADEMVQR